MKKWIATIQQMHLQDQEQHRYENAYNEQDTAPSPKSFRTFQHYHAGNGNQDQAHGKGIAEYCPSFARIIVQFHHIGEQRSPFQALVNGSTGLRIYH